MRLAKHRRSTRPEMNMTPMIDIVFLLLIFFMTVTQVSEMNRERLQLPQLKGTEDQEPAILTINVTHDGQLRMSGETITMAGLVSMVSHELQRLADNPALLTIVVRADERGESRTVNEVVTALGRLRITRIRIAVESPD